jgi:hypothetical protein
VIYPGGGGQFWGLCCGLTRENYHQQVAMLTLDTVLN